MVSGGIEFLRITLVLIAPSLAQGSQGMPPRTAAGAKRVIYSFIRKMLLSAMGRLPRFLRLPAMTLSLFCHRDDKQYSTALKYLIY
jgi:hypothetical protein